MVVSPGLPWSTAGAVTESVVLGAARRCSPPPPSTASAGGVHESQQAPVKPHGTFLDAPTAESDLPHQQTRT